MVIKPTIRRVTEAERKEQMKILTTKERAKARAERAKKAAEAKAAIAQRELEKKLEAQAEKARQLDIMLGRLEPTIGPLAPPTPQSLFQIKRGQAGPAITQAAATRYQQQALSHIYNQAQRQGFERAKDIQLTGLSKTAFDYTKKIAAGTGEFARITRKGAPILQEKIGVVSPTTGKILRYPIESVVRGIEMAGMLPGGVAVIAARPKVIVPAVAVGVAQVAAMPVAIREDPKQFISDIATLGLLFKGVPAAKAAVKFKPTIPKPKFPELKPTVLQKQYLELAAILEAPKVKAPIEGVPIKVTPKKVITGKTTQIEKIDTTVSNKAKNIAKQTVQKEKKDLSPKQEKLVNDKIEAMRDAAYIELKKKWSIEDATYKQINREIKLLEQQGKKVPQWMKDTQFELKISIGKGGRSRARATAEINKVVNDALFKESLEIRTIVKKGATKKEKQAFVKKLNRKITQEKKKKSPSATQIELWERQIELSRTTRATIDEIIARTTTKGRVRGFKELFAEEKAEVRLIPELKPPSQKQINITFRQVHPSTITKNLKTYYNNIPAFKSVKYQRTVTGQWSKTVDKWNSRFVPQMISSKSLTKAQSKILSKSIITAMLKHKATTMAGVLRLLPATTASVYQSLTAMQKQTVQAMVLEMLDTQAKLIGDITKVPPKPKEVKPTPPKKARRKVPRVIPKKPKPKEKVPPKVVKAKEEFMPKIVIPKMRPVKKKKPVKVVRRVVKEYTNFQIVNQIGGINQLFG